VLTLASVEKEFEAIGVALGKLAAVLSDDTTSTATRPARVSFDRHLQSRQSDSGDLPSVDSHRLQTILTLGLAAIESAKAEAVRLASPEENWPEHNFYKRLQRVSEKYGYRSKAHRQSPFVAFVDSINDALPQQARFPKTTLEALSKRIERALDR
jgi:hypothetical protein